MFVLCRHPGDLLRVMILIYLSTKGFPWGVAFILFKMQYILLLQILTMLTLSVNQLTIWSGLAILVTSGTKHRINDHVKIVKTSLCPFCVQVLLVGSLFAFFPLTLLQKGLCAQLGPWMVRHPFILISSLRSSMVKDSPPRTICFKSFPLSWAWSSILIKCSCLGGSHGGSGFIWRVLGIRTRCRVF